MPKNSSGRTPLNAQPHLHQKAKEIQRYGTVTHALPLELEEPIRLEMTEKLNQLLADTITLRDAVLAAAAQGGGTEPDLLEEVAWWQTDDFWEYALYAAAAYIRAAASKTGAPISQVCRELAQRADELGDDGTNDLAVSDVLRTNELQIWFVSQHVVDAPLVRAENFQAAS